MLVVVSPAKKLDFNTQPHTDIYSNCDFLDKSQTLVDIAKKISASDLSNMMGISDKLAVLNKERFNHWNLPFDMSNAKQAVLAFNGDTYTGLDATNLNNDDLEYAQQHLCILSGLYGVLRPLDLIQAYRLEMGTKFKNTNGEDLYDFWGSDITRHLDETCKNHHTPVIINCASNEYFKAISKKELKTPILNIVFKEIKNGNAKIVSFSAKRARGIMARFIIKNRIKNINDLKKFNISGYNFISSELNDATFTFHREQ